MDKKYIGKRMRVRIKVNSSDRYKGQPLFRAIIQTLEAHQIFDATVIRGVGSFGGNLRFHTDRFLSLIASLPIIIEFVDYEERIHALLPEFDAMISEGTITLEKVDVVFYR